MSIESVDQLPAALRPREFKVGDRVRARMSAECPYKSARWDAELHDGITGTVIAVLGDDEVTAPGHRFRVRFDLGMTGKSAASELEPIGADS